MRLDGATEGDGWATSGPPVVVFSGLTAAGLGKRTATVPHSLYRDHLCRDTACCASIQAQDIQEVHGRGASWVHVHGRASRVEVATAASNATTGATDGATDGAFGHEEYAPPSRSITRASGNCTVLYRDKGEAGVLAAAPALAPLPPCSSTVREGVFYEARIDQAHLGPRSLRATPYPAI